MLDIAPLTKYIVVDMKINAVLLSVVSSLGLVAATQAQPSLKSRVDAAVDRAIRERRIVGAVVLIAQDGKIVYHRAAGLSDRETRKPIRENTIFRLASMTKTVVSAAAMRLVEKGVIKLDDPVTKWIPDFRPKLADGTTPTITIHELLTHTAGLDYGFLEPADGPYHQAKVSDGLANPGLSITENLKRLGSAPLLYKPGTSWGYSLAIDVLGEVVARASKKTLAQTVRELVSNPLGLSDLDFSVRDRSRLATPYADGQPQPIRMASPQLVKFGPGEGVLYDPARVFNSRSYASGGAGMVGTASDYLRFLDTLRQGGGRILKPGTVAKMRQNQIGDLSVNVQGPGYKFGYGFAIVVDPKAAKTPQSAGTFEWGGAYGSNWFVDPKKKLTVVIMTNTAVEGMSGKFPVWVRDAVYGVSELK